MGVQTFRIVREKLGYTKYKMAKSLGITPSHYEYLETKAKNTQTEVLIKLQKISGLSPAKFWELFQKEVAD